MILLIEFKINIMSYKKFSIHVLDLFRIISMYYDIMFDMCRAATSPDVSNKILDDLVSFLAVYNCCKEVIISIFNTEVLDYFLSQCSEMVV